MSGWSDSQKEQIREVLFKLFVDGRLFDRYQSRGSKLGVSESEILDEAYEQLEAITERNEQ